jgi:hypothetical protein
LQADLSLRASLKGYSISQCTDESGFAPAIDLLVASATSSLGELNASTDTSDGEDLSLLKFWLDQEGLSVAPVAFQYLEAGDVFEVVNEDGFQVFRSLSFFAVCNLTFDMLVEHPVHCLYEFRKSFRKSLGSQVLCPRTPIFFDNSENEFTYLARERLQPGPAILLVREKVWLPLFKNGTPTRLWLRLRRVVDLSPSLDLEHEFSIGGFSE